jgi:hypothetical protein
MAKVSRPNDRRRLHFAASVIKIKRGLATRFAALANDSH